VKQVIDDRMTIRTILSLIVEITGLNDTYFLVKECVTNTTVGQSLNVPKKTDAIKRWIEEHAEDIVPYTKPNLFLPQ
jgi:hypothetical protein